VSGPLRPERKPLAQIVAELRQQGLDDGEVEEVLVKHYGARVEDDKGFRGAGSSGAWDAAPTPTVGHVEGLTTKLAQGATFGFADEATAGLGSAADAVTAAVQGRNPLTALREGYRARVADERGRERTYSAANPKKALAAEVAGGLAPLVATMGGSAPAQAAGIGGRMAQGAKVGAAMGALTGAGKSEGGLREMAADALAGGVVGGAVGGVFVPVAEGAGKLAGKARVGDASSAVTRFLAERTGSPRLERAGEALGRRGKAASEIAERMEMDEAAGHVGTALHRDVPEMALDRAGPNVMGLAKNVVRTPGEGRTRLAGAVQGRMGGMRDAVTEALERRSGHKAATGISALQEKIEQQRAVGNKMFGAAREATKGQPVQSPTLEQIRRTPIGRQAEEWAKAQRANVDDALPRVEVPGAAPASSGGHHGAARPTARPEIAPEFADIERAAVDNAMEPTHTVELPDPEMVHLMKRYLAKVAKLDVRDGVQGKAAAEAQGALKQWAKIRAELPKQWRQADDAYAVAARLTDAMNQGRNALRYRLNPTGSATRATKESLPAVEQARAAMGADEAAAHQTGAAHAVSSGWLGRGQRTKSPGLFFNASPERERQVALAFPDQPTAEDFRRLIQSWDDVQGRAQTLLQGSDTQGNIAEAAARDRSGQSVIGELLHGNFGNAAKAAVGAVSREAETAEQRAINALIAEYLTSQPDALARAIAAARLRQTLGAGAMRLLPGATGQAGGGAASSW
jgi:hypothetical protein